MPGKKKIDMKIKQIDIKIKNIDIKKGYEFGDILNMMEMPTNIISILCTHSYNDKWSLDSKYVRFCEVETCLQTVKKMMDGDSYHFENYDDKKQEITMKFSKTKVTNDGRTELFFINHAIIMNNCSQIIADNIKTLCKDVDTDDTYDY
jgi:hypothetical protein